MQKRVMGLVLVLASVASAQNSLSCLQQASNRELVNEISARLGSSNAPVSNTIITTSCTSGTLNLRTYNADTGKKLERSTYLGSDCPSFVSSLARVSNVGITRMVLASVCFSGTMNKIAIAIDGSMKDLSSDYVGASCVQMALEANRNLQP